MKYGLIPIAATFFTGVANATSDLDIYHGFAQDNPDLSSGSVYEVPATAVQPGIGDNFNHFKEATDREYEFFGDDWTDLRNEELYGTF